MISAILNAHREGMLARASIESLKRSVAHARSAGYSIEILIVFDRSDEITRDVISKCVEHDFRLFDVTFGDLGQARNYGIGMARGDFIALLDADDLWGIDWLTKAIESAKVHSDRVIWHPEVSAYFGADHHIFRHIDMEAADFYPAGLLFSNYWTSLSFGSRDLYLKNPYGNIDLISGFGFEDWAWNMETIANGIIHKIVPGTGHVIRRKHFSLAKETVAARAVTRPNSFFHWLLSQRLQSSQASALDN